VDEWQNGNGREPADEPRWEPEVAHLITWFQSVTLPAEPFELSLGVRVVDPALAYAALRASIAAGPKGARAQSGALADDLRHLQAVWEQGRRRG
jgi:hypothetical protein